MMMGSSSQRVQPSFTVDPLVQMPRQGGTVIGSMVTTDAVGFSKPACLAHHPSTPHPPPQTQALQYNRAYFTYDLRGHDLSDPDPRPSWSPSKGLLLNGRNVGVHPQSAEEGSLRNHIVYSRAENKTFSTERSSGGSSNSISAAAQDTPAKQGFTYYTRSPGGLRSPTSGPGTIWELPVGGVSLSPQSENSVCLGLAVPKPLYGHPSPCCPELACTGEQRHILEQRGGVHRIHPHLNVYEGWRYSPSPHHQHHPRSLQLEHRVETEGLSDRLPLKDVKDHQHHHHRGSPNRAASAQRFPAFMEPTYSSGYPCSPARGILGPSSSRLGPSFICDSSSSQLSSSPYGADQCQRLQIPSKLSTDHSLVSSHHPSHPSSHPSHPPTNEPMTPSHHGVPVMSQVYQGRSPPNVAKYSQLPATLPMFSYHPQEGAEGGKHRDWEDVVPTGSEQPLPPPPTQTGRHLTSHLPTTPTPPHYLVAQSVYRTDVPMSAHMAPSSHQYLRNFDQPSCHQMYRMPLNAAGQMRTPITSPERPCAPPPSPPSSLQRTERPLDYSLPQYRPPVTSPQVSSPRRHHLSQGHTDSTLPGAPLTVSTTLSLADYGHHNHPTNHHHSNNHATAAKCTTAANYGNHNHHITTANHHITTPNHHNTTSTAKCQGVTGSPVVRIRGSPVPRSNGHGDMVTTATGTLKRCVSDSDRPINVDSPSPKHTQDNGDDVIDVELYQKRQKMKVNGEGGRAESGRAEVNRAGGRAEREGGRAEVNGGGGRAEREGGRAEREGGRAEREGGRAEREGGRAEVNGGRAEVDGEMGRPDSFQSPSPPMPVINHVFSLAPYKAYLEAAGMLAPPVRWSQTTDHQPSGRCVVKPETQSDPHRQSDLHRHQHRQEMGPTSDPHRPERDHKQQEEKPVSINHRIDNHVASEQQGPVEEQRILGAVVEQRILGTVVRSDTPHRKPVLPVVIETQPEPPQRIKTEEMETQQDPEREVEVETKVVKDEEMETQQDPEREVEVKTKVVKEEEMVAETGVFEHDLDVDVIKKCESDKLDSKLSIASDKYIYIMSATNVSKYKAEISNRCVMEGSFTYNMHHHQPQHHQPQHHHQPQPQHHHQPQPQHHHQPQHQPQSYHQPNHQQSQPLPDHYPPNPSQAQAHHQPYDRTPTLRPKSTTPPQHLSTGHRMVGAFTQNMHHPPHSHCQAHHKPYDRTAAPHPKSSTPPQSPNPANTKLNLQNIPPQCLKLTTYKFVLPDNMLRGIPPSPHSTEVPESPTDPAAVAKSCHRPPALSDSLSSSRPARQHFLELHLSLCNLVSSCVSHTPATELQTWLSQLDIYPTSTTSPPPKAQKVTSLLGSGARAVCLRGPETQAALQKVLQRLGQYVAQQQCPFPHVIRAGAVFVPMLVVKALLFPQVQGAYIDQVLQEHKVELRPTTLSEERQLVTLQKRPCSSKLRRLLSLKHLPNIYPDVLNLYYHSCVCKSLESPSPDAPQKTAQV